MHLAQLKLRDFRNYARLDQTFTPGLHVLVGDNAQGKTNILEALYLIATLRSFRGSAGAQMVRHGQKGYFIGATAVTSETHEVKMYWSSRERRLTLDGQPVRKLADYFGVLRAVVFSSEDIQLVKGPASRRRRFLDLLLAQTEPLYLPLLQRYSQALRNRNALLKRREIDEAVLEGFSRELIATGTQIMHFRARLQPQIVPLALRAFRRIAPAEALRLQYQPSVRQDFALELNQSRARERVLRTTIVGPHRDELECLIDDHPAADFGSEGQKRSIAITLKIVQGEYLTQKHGVPPVLLVDDIMGELDIRRRAALMPLLEASRAGAGQAFMTCTEENWPAELSSGCSRWEVAEGKLRLREKRQG